MHVLLTTYLLPGGVLTHVWDLVRHLGEYGIKVSVAIKRHPDRSEPACRYRTKNPAAFIGPIKTVPHIFYDTAQELTDFCKRRQVELIHAHSRLVFQSSFITAGALSLPLIVTLHGIFPWNCYYATTLLYCKKIIAIGPAQTKGAEQYFDKIEIIANGIDTKRFKPTAFNLKTMPAGLKVLWFGRSHGVNSKGVTALNNAIRILRSRRINVSAWLAGSVTGATVDQFKVLGWVTDPVSVLQQGHIAFGHGRALREAMSCGNAGFLLGHGFGGRVKKAWFQKNKTTPVSAIPEYNLPEPDAETIAACITHYINDTELLCNHRLESREIAVKYFDVTIMIDSVVKAYKL